MLTKVRVYNVGPDGVPELVEVSSVDNTMSKATEIWHSIRVGYLFLMLVSRLTLIGCGEK